MQNLIMSVLIPLAQTGGADELPNLQKPWQQNWLQDAVTIAFALLFLLLIWLWARSGRSKRENKVPFERTAEDFAGTVQAGYGVVPAFLYVVYAAALIAMAGYIVVSMINGVQY